MPSLSILIADDEAEIRHLLEHWLAVAGHAVIGVGDAVEAAERLQKQLFDLVVTDIVMPNGDGLKLIAEFRRACPEGRILAISGGGRFMDSADYLKMARGFGADAAIMKPFTRPQFLAAVNQALAPKDPPAHI